MKNLKMAILWIAFVFTATLTYAQDGTPTQKPSETTPSSTPAYDCGVEIKGIKWATRNVNTPGNFTEKPENAGMFYQWNKKMGWSSNDPLKNSDGGASWDRNESKGATWEKANDPCPPGWRLPTQSELSKLCDAEGHWGVQNDVSGYFFGSDTSSIFLPAAGCRLDSHGKLNTVGSGGYYWGGTCNGPACNIYFSSGSGYLTNYNRGFGLSIRCVAE